MMNRGKSLKIYMMDGTINGIWRCSLSGRTTMAYRIPRNNYSECKSIDELSKTAVYLLFGENENGNPAVYIGETDDAFKRLGNHVESKEFWTEAVIFISRDEHFNKAHVKYLESRLYSIAAECGRYELMNSTIPVEASIAKDEQDEMEEFIDNVRLISNALAFKVFNPLREEGKEEYYYIKSGDADAKMIRTAEGYVVCKGSKIRIAEDTKSTPASMIRKRDILINDGAIVDGIFTKDVLFKSPSGASDLVKASSTSGPREWKNSKGQSLSEVMKAEEQ